MPSETANFTWTVTPDDIATLERAEEILRHLGYPPAAVTVRDVLAGLPPPFTGTAYCLHCHEYIAESELVSAAPSGFAHRICAARHRVNALTHQVMAPKLVVTALTDALTRGRTAIEARIVTLEGQIAEDPIRSKAQIDALKFALGEDPTPVTAERYREMLEVLPPARWAHDGFLVGEPHDHSGPEGHARYAYFYRRGDEHFEAGLLTEAQFNARHPRSK